MVWRSRQPICFALAGFVTLVGATVSGPARAEVDPLLIDRARAEIADGHVSAGFAVIENAIRNRETAPEARIDLLGAMARLWAEQNGFKNAGHAYARRAAVMRRQLGADAPELPAAYTAAADAFAKAGEWTLALTAAREAFEIDTLYYDCGSDIIARDHARLADALEGLGETAEAAEHRRLANAPAQIRCIGERSSEEMGPVVVTNDTAGADEKQFTRVKIFYATDRARSGSDRPDEFYGGERGEMEYGTVEVTVPRNHKPGEIEAPSLVKLEWAENAERHIVMTKLATGTEQGLFADMRATLADNQADGAFVFIHGFNTTFSAAAKRTAQIAYDINYDGAPILFSWPSEGSTFSYIRDEAVVRLSGRHLLHFLDDVIAQSGAKHINLIAHSMGNRALLDALELMATRREGAGQTGPVFGQIIFAAPDEDASLFAEMLKTISPLAERLTLYGSNKDLALNVSKRVHGDLPRAGQAGDGIVVTKGLDSIDMTVLGDDMLAHSYFAQTSSALTDLLTLFWRDADPDERCGMDPKTGTKGAFWQYDAARCNGPVMLSALTLLRKEGKAAIQRINSIISNAGKQASESRREAEWREIRTALAALVAIPN